jgi:hypothetical protein
MKRSWKAGVKMAGTSDSQRSLFARLFPALIEAWIAFVIIAFFLTRVLGSGTGQRILHLFGLRRPG